MSCCRKATIPPSALRAATSLYTREALLSAHSWFCRERGLPPTSPHVRGVGANSVRPCNLVATQNSAAEQCSPLQQPYGCAPLAPLEGSSRAAGEGWPRKQKSASSHPSVTFGDSSPRRGALPLPTILAPEGSIGEGYKSVKKNAALLHFLAFGPFDHIIGVPRGRAPWAGVRCLGTARLFSLPFLVTKKEGLPEEAF